MLCTAPDVCDTYKTPLIVDATQAEPVTKSSHEKVTKINVMHMARFHQGNDGRVRQLCGPRISCIISKPKISYVTRLLDSRDIGTSVHGRMHMVSSSVRPCLIKEKIQGRSHTHKMARDPGGFQNKW